MSETSKYTSIKTNIEKFKAGTYVLYGRLGPMSLLIGLNGNYRVIYGLQHRNDQNGLKIFYDGPDFEEAMSFYCQDVEIDLSDVEYPDKYESGSESGSDSGSGSGSGFKY